MKINFFFQKLFLFSFLLAISLLFSSHTLAARQGMYLENTRLRAEPSFSGQILQVIPAQTSIEILEEKNGWYRVKIESGIIGWSMKEFVQEKVETPKKVETPTFISPSVTNFKKGDSAETLFNSRIRKTPFVTDGNIQETVSQSTKVKILALRSKWYRVEYGKQKTGWIMSELVGKAGAPEATGTLPFVEETNQNINTGDIGTSEYQVGQIPEEVDLEELNKYWLAQVNALRAKKNLRQLVLDNRWVDTATEWAGYMGKKGIATHTRPDGKSMHKWIDTKGLQWTKRYSENGWQTNYFTENIAWGISDGTTQGVKRVLDNTLAFFLAEESYNGDHYRTTYHKDWNSVGLGFYFAPSEYKGKYKVFVAFHYGSLELK